MVNLTEDGNHTSIQDFVCTPHFNGRYQTIIVSTLNALLAITAFLENALLIAVLPKVSSLHPPSKLLLARRGQTTPQMFHEGSICFFHIFLNQVWQMSFDCCPVHFQLEVVTKCQIMTS